jgi:hypothetical protein
MLLRAFARNFHAPGASAKRTDNSLRQLLADRGLLFSRLEVARVRRGGRGAWRATTAVALPSDPSAFASSAACVEIGRRWRPARAGGLRRWRWPRSTRPAARRVAARPVRRRPARARRRAGSTPRRRRTCRPGSGARRPRVGVARRGCDRSSRRTRDEAGVVGRCGLGRCGGQVRGSSSITSSSMPIVRGRSAAVALQRAQSGSGGLVGRSRIARARSGGVTRLPRGLQGRRGRRSRVAASCRDRSTR